MTLRSAPTAAEVSAWQRLLELQHEAVWTLELVGARFDQIRRDARATLRQVLVERDATARLLAAADAVPRGPRAGYDRSVPEDLRTAKAWVADVERRLATAALLCFRETTESAARRRALDVAMRAARLDVSWGGTPVAFPGLAP